MSVTHKEKAKQLAKGIVENWGLDAIIEYTRDKITERLSSLSPEELEEEWQDFWNPSREN